MKVVYILPISWGGIPHYTAELANAVSKYADVTVLKPKDTNDDLFSDDIEVMNVFDPLSFSREQPIEAFSLKNIKNLFSFRNIRIVDQIKPDIIHFTGHYPHSAFFTYLYNLNKKNRLICTMHATFAASVVSMHNRGFFIALLNSISEFSKKMIEFDRTIAHTQANKSTLIKRGIDPEKITVIPHGAYTFFKKYSGDEIESDENCVLYFGYIVKNKGVEYLIKAVPIISKEISDINVIIAGEGNFSKYSKYLEDESKFEIHNEFIPNEEVPELFMRAKVVVLPYTYHQGHSGVLSVAFSFGKAVIITNVGDLPNLIEDGKEGLVVPSKDPEALAEAIITLLKDDALRKEMEENARKKAQELSWDNIAKRHIEVYEEAIHRRKIE